MTSIFKDIKPPLGKYYTSNGKSGTEGINSIITVSDTEVVFETIYKDQEYKKIQLTNPESLQSDGVDGSYSFNNIDMKDYLITLQIMYSPNIEALKVPYASISYLDLNKNFITNLQSPRGVGVIPPNFILSEPARSTRLRVPVQLSVVMLLLPLILQQVTTRISVADSDGLATFCRSGNLVEI